MEVIYYNRISTDNKDQDPTSNLEVCKNFCKYNNHKIIDQIIDKGVSGSVPYYDRQNGKEITQIAEKYYKMNKPLGIVVFSIDRFSREHPVRALSNIEDLKEKGVQILSATENIFNEDSEFALPMQFNILWFNYYFLLQHSKKVKAGIEKRRKAGLFVGRGLVKEIKGTGKNKEFIYYSDEELNEIHNRIKDLNKKHSYRELQAILKEKNVNVSLSYISEVINNKK